MPGSNWPKANNTAPVKQPARTSNVTVVSRWAFLGRLAEVFRHGRPRPGGLHGRIGVSLAVVRGWRGGAAVRRRLGGHLRKLIHPLPAFRIYFGRLAQDRRQDLMAGGNFRQMNVRFEANLFKIRHLGGGQRIVEIFRHGIGVQVRPRSVTLGADNRSRRITSRMRCIRLVAN